MCLQAKVRLLYHRNLEVLDNPEPVHRLLRQESGRGEHGESSVLQLPRDHEVQLLGIGRLDPEGIEPDVPGVVVVAEQARLIVRRVRRIDPADLRALRLRRPDEGDYEGVPSVRDLCEVGDGRAGYLAVEEEGGPGDGLPDEETEDGEHRHAAVGDLGLAVPLQRPLVRLGGESEGVEEPHGRERSRHVVDGEGAHRGGGGPGYGRGCECGGGADEGGGDGKLHHVRCCCCVEIVGG